MKQIIFFISCFVIANISFCQTQSELNEKAHKDLLKANKELNDVYKKILQEYNFDTLFIKNFKAAQKLWLQLRDAEMKAKFPHANDGSYGSVFPMCWSMELQSLTEQRTKDIKIWLDGVEEGDVCNGSVKVKH